MRYMQSKTRKTMKKINPGSFWEGSSEPMPFEALTNVEGDPYRHIEQLWDEVKRLKEKITNLEKQIKEQNV